MVLCIAPRRVSATWWRAFCVTPRGVAWRVCGCLRLRKEWSLPSGGTW
nr:MAG TPA: hypothetical protein [Caudoviricetes sp.]